MLERIDHLVIAVPDPDAAADELAAALGLAATGGGRHASGTWNRLVFLGDSYLELIGTWDEELAAAHPIGAAALAVLRAAGGGLATWALAVPPGDLGALTERLRAAGSPIAPPVPGHRDRPDGIRVRWATAVAGALGFERPPFLIEHESDGPEWGAAARGARARATHPFGGTARLVGLELALDDPAALADACGQAVGLAFAFAPGAAPGAREARIGDQQVHLVPRSPLGSGPVCRVGIRGDAGARAQADLFGIRFARL